MILSLAVFLGICSITGAKSTVLCKAGFSCRSESYSYVECKTNNDLELFNVTVTFKLSRSNCTYYNRPRTYYSGTDGVYGFHGNTIWVDKGCKAIFQYCLTAWTTSKPAALTTSQSTKITTESTGGYGTGIKTQTQGQKQWIQDIPNEAVIGVSVVLISIVVVLIVTGLCLWRKRFGRFTTFYKHARPAIGRYNTNWRNQNIQIQKKSVISTMTKPTIPVLKTPSISAGKTPTISVDNHKDAKQDRYVNYLNVSRPKRPPAPAAGMLKKGNQIRAEQTGTVKTRLAPIPPKPPKPRNHYENTVTRGDNDEYLVPVSNRGDIKPAGTGTKKVTRAVENDYQSIEQDHIYATIE